MLEHWFGFGKGVAKYLTDRRSDLTWNVIVREQAEADRKRMFPLEGQTHEEKTEGPMLKFRGKHPLSNVAIPHFLIEKFPSEWRALKEKRLEAFGHGGTWEENGAYTVFKVTGEAGAIPTHAGELGSYLGVQPSRPPPAIYKTCTRPSNEWFEYQQRTDGWKEVSQKVTNNIMKKYLYDHGLTVGGTKATLISRIGQHLLNKYGAPLEEAAAAALRVPKAYETDAEMTERTTANDQGVDENAGADGDGSSESPDPVDAASRNPNDAPPREQRDTTADTINDTSILTVRLVVPDAPTTATPTQGHTLEGLRAGVQPHPYFPPAVPWPGAPSARRETRFAYRVIDLGVPEGDIVPSAGSNSLSERDFSTRLVSHVKGDTPSVWISASLDLNWALFFACKSILIRGNARAKIVEIDLEKIDTIVDISLPAKALARELPNYWATCAWSASEILLPHVPADALSGSAWQLDEHSRIGGAILSIRGNDHEKKGVVIKKFGRYELWKEYFDGKYPNETRLANALKALEIN